MAGVAAPARRRRSRAAAVLGLDLVLATAWFHQAWAAPTSSYPGSGGDPVQALSFMAWIGHAIVHGANPLLDTAINHPDGVNLMWNTSTPALAPLMAPLIALAGPVLAYNLLVTLSVALSAWCGYLAVAHFVGAPGAAIAGGLLYGFSPYLQAQALGHPDLFVAVTPPLLLILLDDILVRQHRPPVRAGVLCGLLALFQLFVAEEVLATEALLALVAVAIVALLHRDAVRPRLAHALAALGTAAAVAAPVALPALAWQFLGPGVVHGPIHPPGRYVTDPLALVLPVREWVAPLGAPSLYVDHISPNLTEATGYLGVPLLAALAAVAFRHRRRPEVRVLALVGAVALLLSLGDRLHLGGAVTAVPLPWAALQRLPLLEQVLPSRLMVHVDLIAAVLLGILLEGLLQAGRRVGRPAAAAVAVAVGVSLIPAPPGVATPERPAYFTTGAAQRIAPGSVILLLPYAEDYYDDAAMLWQVDAGLRFSMPGGYVIGSPQPVLPVDASRLSTVQWLLAVQRGRPVPLTERRRREVRAQLRRWDVDTVVIGPSDHQGDLVGALAGVLGRPPQRSGGVWVWSAVAAGIAADAAG